MSVQMDRLTQSVTTMTTAADGAIALIQGVSALVRDAAGDRAKSVALADELDAKAQDMVQAVVANTPDAGSPGPSDPPVPTP